MHRPPTQIGGIRYSALRADLDNFNKLSLDALSGIVYEDDSQIAELRLKRAYDKTHPRLEVRV